MVIVEARTLDSGLLKRNYLFRRGIRANSSASGLRSGYSLTSQALPPCPCPQEPVEADMGRHTREWACHAVESVTSKSSHERANQEHPG